LKQLNEFGKPDAEAICKMPSYHAVILAKNETGRINLYRLISESHLHYFRRRPRLPKSLFLQWREGLLIGSACEAGELYRALVEEKPEEEIDRLVRFYDYLEIQPLDNNAFMVRDEDRYPQIQDENDLMEINRKIVELGEIYHKLVVATCDVHFLNPEDEIYRRIIMSGKGFTDADQQAPLYYRTTEEMLAEFQYLGAKKAEEIVITNTNRIADMIDRIRPCSPRKCPPVIANSDQDLRDICYNRAHEIYGDDLPPQVTERLERELTSIIGNGYAVMYIIAQKLVWKSVEDGYLVGSRGSVGSSFAATMAGITEINPLPAHYYCSNCHYYDFDDEVLHANAGTSACDMPDKTCPKCGTLLNKEGHDIPFETFLGFKGDKEPDIDLNFSNEYQSNAHDYTEVIFGAGQTFRAGTVGTMADKTAYGYVKKYCEEHETVKRSAEMERIAQGCVGVRRTTGQHPGGIVVLPIGEEIYTFTPVQHPANDMSTKIITTHFDYHKIDANLLKLDILGHLDPTMIRMLEDLTDIDASALPMDDPGVLSLFASTEALGITPEDIGGCTLGCLGIPEFGTNFVMGMLLDAKPRNFSDLVRISGLSHGTDVWLNNAQYYIQKGDCTLSTAICTRDDIMIYLISKGVENERSFKIMEAVRKGTVAKGKCAMWEEWKQDMLDHDVPQWYIESCEKIKYMFPKAHAAAYVMMALRVAYFKVHEPLAYYAAFFSIRALDAFNYELMCQGRERLEYYMKDYNKRKDSLSNKEKEVYEIMRLVQEMYARGLEFTPIDIYRSKATRFQIVDGKIMPSFAAIDGLGAVAAEMIEDEAAKGKFLSREDFKNRCKVSATTIEAMGELGLFGDLPHTNQISLMDFMEMA
ncbi:MAG: PolC-type DNA polymerase III, partial [Lachnospiraceae bacterium]|nr:PolC-type DNA polymerase III [Lachnospiraceae bacterium]